MEKIKKGDIVARKSHNQDILFSVEDILGSSCGIQIAILKGITIRVVADAYIDDLMLLDTKKALADKNITLDITDKAKEALLQKGTDLKYGARPLRRAIQRYIEDELSEKILRGELKDGQNIKINVEDDRFIFSIN